MGISGLIPFLEKASTRVHLKDLHGSTVAIDIYCWLHKGAFGCAEKLVRGEPTDQYWQYCMRYLDLLLSYNIKPILVFDGQHLPAKALTEKRRRENRQQSRKLAAELLRKGRTEEARSQMRRCVDITHEMALRLIRECRLRNIDCIVAPYEADAQMAWLNKVELAQYVITEDSDLTLFGAKRIIFKLDLTGAGLLVDCDKLHLAMGCPNGRYDFEKFRRMCILSGCDYLDSLPGIGLAKACKFILMTEEDDMWRALKKIPSYLKMKNLEVEDEYIEEFLKAEATFRHMYIYNPIDRRMERLNNLSVYQTEERYCSNAGTAIEDMEIALQLALGNLNPFTLKQVDNWHPDKHFGLAQATNKNIKRAKHKSIWQKSYQTCNSMEEESVREKPDNCALYFKKVDFISKTINEDIKANALEEEAKEGESEIFSIYQQEVEDLLEPSGKRQRCMTPDDTSEGDSEMPMETTIINRSHNPFAKSSAFVTPNLYQQSVVCENASLLRVLSPKKLRYDEEVQKLLHAKNSKIIIKELEEKVTVKSRFFAKNVKEVSESTTSNIRRNLSDEIDAIENHTLRIEEIRSQLYDSPSPKKPLNTKQLGIIEDEEFTDKSLKDETTITEAEDERFQTCSQTSNCIDKHDDIITLSDDEFDKTDQTRRSLTLSSAFVAFKSQEKQRLGLSKSKRKLSLKSSRSNGKSTSDGTLQNQSRLTMFGFKKRSTIQKF